jgi:hypothetical protein
VLFHFDALVILASAFPASPVTDDLYPKHIAVALGPIVLVL